jgi:DNA-directed RNA polymerase specialized sigma24 family protein
MEQVSTAGVTAALRLRHLPVLRAQAARRDPAALAAMYERHHQALYRYCRSILHDEEDARDALQSTMAKALAALRNEERNFELRPWLFRIAHNEAISRLRQRRATVDLDAVGPLGRTRWRSRWRTASAWRCCSRTCATCPSVSARRSFCAS